MNADSIKKTPLARAAPRRRRLLSPHVYFVARADHQSRPSPSIHNYLLPARTRHFFRDARPGIGRDISLLSVGSGRNAPTLARRKPSSHGARPTPRCGGVRASFSVRLQRQRTTGSAPCARSVSPRVRCAQKIRAPASLEFQSRPAVSLSLPAQ